MYLATMRRSALISPVALAVAVLLAASPALAQPTTGESDSHASPVDDPGMSTPAPPIPAATESLWFYVKDGTKQGPVTTAVLRQLVLDGELVTTNKVWKNGMAGWMPLATLPEFADMAPPPPPVDSATPERKRVPISVSSEPEPARIRNRGYIVSGALVFGITWIAGITSAVFASEDEGSRSYDPNTGLYTEDDVHQTYSEIAWLPVVGPIAGYAGAGGDDNRVILLMCFWSAAQATGLGLFIAGMVGKKNPKYKGEEASIQFAPLVGQVNGMGLTGRF